MGGIEPVVSCFRQAHYRPFRAVFILQPKTTMDESKNIDTNEPTGQSDISGDESGTSTSNPSGAELRQKIIDSYRSKIDKGEMSMDDLKADKTSTWIANELEADTKANIKEEPEGQATKNIGEDDLRKALDNLLQEKEEQRKYKEILDGLANADESEVQKFQERVNKVKEQYGLSDQKSAMIVHDLMASEPGKKPGFMLPKTEKPSDNLAGKTIKQQVEFYKSEAGKKSLVQ